MRRFRGGGSEDGGEAFWRAGEGRGKAASWEERKDI